jgi:hypothetical protein
MKTKKEWLPAEKEVVRGGGPISAAVVPFSFVSICFCFL